jgi:cytochrome c peroxidase
MKKKLLLLFLIPSLIVIGNTALIAKQPELTSLEKLGQKLYNDQNLSVNGNQSCQTCHHPAAKFVDPENRQEPVEFPVSDGSDPTLFGGRNAPSAAYAKFSPNLQWDGELFIGGMFWDGRASGNEVTDTGGLGAGSTYDPLADQAKGPFQNPVEMSLGSDADVVDRVLASNYADQFLAEFALYYNHAYDPLTDEGKAYNFVAIAIAEFEKSFELNKFSSRFDAFLAEQGGDVSSFGVEVVDGIRQYVGPPAGFKSKYLSYDEADGLAIFNADSYQQLGETNPGVPNGGMCYLCHLTEAHDENTPPVFTDFSYDNLGVPVNPQIETLAGTQPIDYGLGAQTAILDDAYGVPYGITEEWCKYEAIPDDGFCETVTVYPSEIGKFKEPTLRNIANTAPYFHNGAFATLEEVVEFYNKRDEIGFDPEVSENVNDGELGNLGLELDQEQKLVLFMRTLTDE